MFTVSEYLSATVKERETVNDRNSTKSTTLKYNNNIQCLCIIFLYLSVFAICFDLLKKLSNNKADGEGEISGEMLKAAEENIQLHLLSIFN